MTHKLKMIGPALVQQSANSRMHYALCPNCFSTLQISEQQIKVKDGLVRCGQCRKVFNALTHQIEQLTQHPLIEKKAKHTTTKALHKTANDEPLDVTWEIKKQPSSHLFIYSFLSLILILALTTQYILFNASSLTQNLKLQAVIVKINNQFKLNIPRYNNTEGIQILSRELSPHPTVEKTLQLQLNIKNTAPIEQDYPVITLILMSESGDKVAYGRFEKEDYLNNINLNSLFKKNSTLSIHLNIVSPQQSVSGYEIGFIEQQRSVFSDFCQWQQKYASLAILNLCK